MENAIVIKNWICTTVGILGGWISCLYGGWTPALIALVVCMAVDYATGLAVAGCHKSIKSKSGGIDSSIGWVGLVKKGVTLLMVLVGNMLDMAMGIHYIREALVIGFLANECISIVENAGLLGLWVPKFFVKLLDQLKDQAEKAEHKMGGGGKE